VIGAVLFAAFAAGVLVLGPAFFVIVGIVVGGKRERKEIEAYLRSLPEPVLPTHLATRIRTGAHREREELRRRRAGDRP
jgi:hypothetical protein